MFKNFHIYCFFIIKWIINDVGVTRYLKPIGMEVPPKSKQLLETFYGKNQVQY
ncbi:hypothetical protein L950_0225375 [Sphingobacterium sp. IITKGP-BTPF85]|nr:hypothetical protein L950_0225375 [Sphingobacterium sp. IITKGP-BTPF85]